MKDSSGAIYSTFSRIMDITKELHSIEIEWEEILPQSLVEWLDVFSGAHNVVKEIMFPGILSAVSGLMAPKTKLKMSEIEEEPVNLFAIVLAPPGAGKTAALRAGIENPIVNLEASIDMPILVEDFTRSGVFLHLKTTEGMGVFAKDEVHVVMENMVGSSKNKEIDKDLLIKFFDNAQWSVNKGNTAKRERILQTGVSFFGLSQPESFLDLYGKMSKKGNGLVDRILCCCPKPLRLTRLEVNEKVARLQQFGLQNLDSVYEHIYHRHNSADPILYTLSAEAFQYFIEQEKKLVEAQNKIFSGTSSFGVSQNISKAAKLVLRLSVVLHVFTDQMMRSLCHSSDMTRETPTSVGIATVKRAFNLGNWFLDNRNILEKSLNAKSGPDSFAVAKKILQTPGPFVTIRMVCRMTHSTSSIVVAAMEKLEREQLGQVDQELKSFYKCPPISAREENLQLYEIDIIQYSDAFRKGNESISNNQWNLLMANAPQQGEVSRYFVN